MSRFRRLAARPAPIPAPAPASTSATPTGAALERFRRTGDPLAGSTDPAVRQRRADAAGARARSGTGATGTRCCGWPTLQTRTTHGSPATLAASRVFAHDAGRRHRGRAAAEILASRQRTGSRAAGAGCTATRSRAPATWCVRCRLRSGRCRGPRISALRCCWPRISARTPTRPPRSRGSSRARSTGRRHPGRVARRLAWRERLEETAGRLFDAGSSGAKPTGQEDEMPSDHWALQ